MPEFVIAIGYRKEVSAIFSHQQPRNEGDRWAPLSEKYAIWKEKHFPGQPILVRTGALRASMTEQGAPGNITIISRTGAVLGSSISYGIYHDLGGSTIPRRNFSEPSEPRKKIWKDQLVRAIIHSLEQSGIDAEAEEILQ